ncbi:MAG: glycosyltransferase family 4 protein [Candidatus Hinthialibacter antarcticus]|nr:glycosyltransferase family 4 protein [Candidatus Hinthialibacter antarcticus]
MERLRILHVTSECGWRGGENQLLLLLRQQRKLGHSAALAAPPGSTIADKFLQEGGVFSLKQRSDLDIFAAWELSHIMQAHECEVIHAHTGRAHAIAAFANRFNKRNIPLIVSRRVSFSLKNSPWNRLKYQSADHFIPVSNAARTPLLQIGVNEKAITIIPDGVDADMLERKSRPGIREEFGISESAFVVGNVAHCELNKNQALILDAAPEIIQAHPGIQFIMVGDGKELNSLKQKTAELGVKDNFIFPGFRNDIERFYQAFDCFVITSLEEGLCSSILEAQCCGVPVVATRAGGIPEIIEDKNTGLLIDKSDKTGLVDALTKILNDREFSANLGLAGKNSVLQNFTIEIIAEQTLDVYRKVIRQK